MCTAITYGAGSGYFGRTLDHDRSYGQQVVVLPRRFPLPFRHQPRLDRHYAMIGMASMTEGYPLFFDGVNEMGLAMAGLNFPGNAVYGPAVEGKENVAVFELIPWLLAQCANLAQARQQLEKIQLVDTAFRPDLPPAQLHWLIADSSGSITVEAVAEGLRIYDNPVGVLTNNPPFPMQLFRLNDFMGLSPKAPENRFSGALALEHYCRGMGAMGLPGDVSSVSRFVRAAFVKLNSVSGPEEAACVSQCFHILGAVEQSRGCCVADGQYETTQYTSCCSLRRGIYYYTTYDNHQITAVDMHREDPKGRVPVCYPLTEKERFFWQNRPSGGA